MSQSAPPQTNDTMFDGLRAQLRGGLATPGERGYELRDPWNAAVQLTPRADHLIVRDCFRCRHGYPQFKGLRVAHRGRVSAALSANRCAMAKTVTARALDRGGLEIDPSSHPVSTSLGDATVISTLRKISSSLSSRLRSAFAFCKPSALRTEKSKL